MKEEDRKLLEENGWIVECEAPLEISHKRLGGGVATGYGAEVILDTLKYQNENAVSAMPTKKPPIKMTSEEIRIELDKLAAEIQVWGLREQEIYRRTYDLKMELYCERRNEQNV